MSPNAKQVNVGGETILVLAEAGIWSASFKDAMTSIKSGSPSSLLQRKAKLISAIETYSGCKVSDSTADPGMLSLHASVRCP